MRIAIAGVTGLVGARVARLAREQGHEVVGLARATGFDLRDAASPRLEAALAGADGVIDVTSAGGTGDEEATTRFFSAVALNLGRAAEAAGVARGVVLSIVGIDRGQDFPYYRAKLVHEEAFVRAVPGAQVLRATQFHDFARQMYERGLKGGTTSVMDVPIQPVDTAEVARLLLDMVTGLVPGDVDLGGPQPERLVDLVRRYTAHIGSPVSIEEVRAPASLAAGSMMPGGDALLRGRDWQAWLETQTTRR